MKLLSITHMVQRHTCRRNTYVQKIITYRKKAACRILSIASPISLKHHFRFKESSIGMNSQRTGVPCILEHWARTHLCSLLLVPCRYSLFPVRLAWAHRDLPGQLSQIWSAGMAVYTALCTLRSTSPPHHPLPTPLGLCLCCLLPGAFFLNLPGSWPTSLYLAFLYGGFNSKWPP